MLNKYPGKCSKCYIRVSVGTGSYYRGAVFCAECSPVKENWKPDPDPSNGEEIEDFYHAFHGDW